MNIESAKVVLRSRGTGEIFDLALRFCTGPAFSLYAKLSAIFILPGLVACTVLWLVVGLEWPYILAAALGWGMLIESPFTVAASRLMFEDDVTVGAVVRAWGSRLPSYLGALLVSRVALAAGMSLFWIVVPALWALAAVTFVHEASLLERAGPFAAVARSYRFSRRSLGAAVALQFMMLVAMFGFVAVAELLGNMGLVEFVFQLGAPVGRLQAGGSLFMALGLLLAAPYIATVRFLAYLDGRTVQDGWDVQVRCMAIVARNTQAIEEEAA